MKTRQAAGLLPGRGASGDLLLLARWHGTAVSEPSRREWAATLRDYRDSFRGETQIPGKLKIVLSCIDDHDFKKVGKKMKRCKGLERFADLITAGLPKAFENW